MNAQPAVAYKVLTATEMAALLNDGRFSGALIDLADGYIHLSTAEQLAGTIAKHFAGQSGLHLAAVDLDRLGDSVRWELSRGDQLFPHIYGELPMAAVIAHRPLELRDDGPIALPAAET